MILRLRVQCASMNTAPTSTQALILFAHGSSNPTWREPFDDIARKVQTLLAKQGQAVAVQLAFLELMSPSVDQAIHDLTQQGVRDIRIVPLFFGVGKHIAEDLRNIIDAAQMAHPDVVIQIMPALGQSDWMRQAMAEYAVRTLTDSASG